MIVSRGVQALLSDRGDATHVRIICGLDERVRRTAADDEMTMKAAHARIEDSDR